MRRHQSFMAIVLLLLFAAGCIEPVSYAIDRAARRSIDRSVDRAVDQQVDQQVEREEERRRERHSAMGDAMARQMLGGSTQMLMQVYTSIVFSLAFHSGGYALGERPYRPGDYTRWSVEAGGEPTGSWMERACLFDDAEGNRWWKVKYFDAESGDTVIMEALLSADMTRMLRLRAKLPGEEAREFPVEEGTAFVPPRTLSKHSVKGAEQGTAKVKVPAGTFTARHIVFGGAEGAHEWWLVDSVPGGHVRYTVRHAADPYDDEPAGDYVLSLSAFGSDAKSELGTAR